MKTIHSSQTGHRDGHNRPPASRETIDVQTTNSRRGLRRLTRLFSLAGGFFAASVACGQFQPAVGPIDIPVTLNVNTPVTHPPGVASPSYTLTRQVSNGGSTIQYTVDRPAGLSDVFFSRNRVFAPINTAGFNVEAAFVGDHGLIFKVKDSDASNVNLSFFFLDLSLPVPLENHIFQTLGEANLDINNPNPQLFLNADGTCLFMRVFINQALFPDTVGLNVFRTDTGASLCSMPDRNREGNNDRFTADILDVLAPAGADTVRIRHIQTLSGNSDHTCLLPVPAVQPPPAPPVVQRVSIDSGNFGGNAASSSPSTSRDGRFIAFVSSATNLVPNDTNGVADVFLRDTLNGTTTRVSVRGANTQATGGASGSPAISADGRFIVFSSSATNLVTGDTNGVSDIFVRDTINGTTERVSVTSTGLQGNGASSSPAISADGQVVAFSSVATNLVTGDTNAVRDVFVRGRTGNSSIRRASLATGGTQANGLSESPKLSSNGNVVAFKSRASNLVRDDRNNLMDVFARVRSTGTTTRVSVLTGGGEISEQRDGPQKDPVLCGMSGDGRLILFSWTAPLVSGDTNYPNYDVFVHDRLANTPTTTRVSVGPNDVQAKGNSINASISEDGRFVAFDSDATNLVQSDTNARTDVFLRDWSQAVTARVSEGPDATQADGSSDFPSISGDGQHIAFRSFASNLFPKDENGTADVYVRDRGTLDTGTFTLEPDHATLPAQQAGILTFSWTVPNPRNWHDLDELQLRIRDDEGSVLWVKFNEADRSFSVFNEAAGRFGKSLQAGVNRRLTTPWASLDLANTRVIAAGPTAPEVKLELAVEFKNNVAGHTFTVDVFARDDHSGLFNYTPAGTLEVTERIK